MRLGPKLTLGILAAAAVPLVVSGLAADRTSREALTERVLDAHARLAANAGDGVAEFLEGVLSDLEVYPRVADLEGGAPDVVTGVLQVAYHAGEDLTIVALLDEHGAERVGSVFLQQPAAAAAMRRPAVSPAERDAFLARVPLAQALREGRAVGTVARVGERGAPRVAVAVVFAGERGRLVLAADVSLDRVIRRLEALSTGGTRLLLVDQARQGVSGAGPAGAAVVVPGDQDPGGPLPASVQIASVETGGERQLAAFAPAAYGLGVLVQQPEHAAFAGVRELRRRTWYWLGVAMLVAVVVGVALARDVAKRVGVLTTGTEAIARGQLDTRVAPGGDDEIAALAAAMNKMAGEISGKNRELEAWGQELAQRVEAKTRELRQAEDLLLRSRTLAASSTLSAGMAHEIANPLTGILGAAQLMLLELPDDAPARPLLVDLEHQAQRIRAVLDKVRKLGERAASPEGGAGDGDPHAPVDLGALVHRAAAELPAAANGAKVEVVTDVAAPPPRVLGDATRLLWVLAELAENARRAMPSGGTLRLRAWAPDVRLAAVEVADNGVGIAAENLDKIFDPFFTTKSHWNAQGLGLPLVHRVVEAHGGSVAVESRPGEGTRITLRFPAAPEAHLA